MQVIFYDQMHKFFDATMIVSQNLVEKLINQHFI